MDKCIKCGTLFKNKKYATFLYNNYLFIECENCGTKNYIEKKEVEENYRIDIINKICSDINNLKQDIDKLKRKKR